MAIPNQEAPVVETITPPDSNDEGIRNVARGFLNAIEKDDDPEQHPHEEDPAEDQPPQETQAEESETEAETPPESEVPMVEVDVDGEKYMVPEKVKHRVMADKDYRQKTMEIAATKKSLEAQMATAASLAQQAQQLAPFHAQLHAMDTRAQQLQTALQSDQALMQQPVEYNRVQGELMLLLRSRDQLAAGLQQQMQSFSAQQQKLRSEKLAVEAPQLFQEFPDLAKPDVQMKLAKYVQDSGLPLEAMDYLNYSVPGAKLAWKAHQYDQMVRDQATAAAKLRAKTQNLPAATQSSRAGDGAKDKQLFNDWQKRGAKHTDPAFSQLLRAQLRGK